MRINPNERHCDILQAFFNMAAILDSIMDVIIKRTPSLLLDQTFFLCDIMLWERIWYHHIPVCLWRKNCITLEWNMSPHASVWSVTCCHFVFKMSTISELNLSLSQEIPVVEGSSLSQNLFYRTLSTKVTHLPQI